jgi:hypothetical protein
MTLREWLRFLPTQPGEIEMRQHTSRFSPLWTLVLLLFVAPSQAQFASEQLRAPSSAVPGELVVTFKTLPGEKPSYLVIKNVPADVLVTAASLHSRRELGPLVQLVRPYLPENAVGREDEITDVSPNYRGSFQWQYVPNDPLYAHQWYLPHIGMPDAWAFYIERLFQGRVQLGTVIAIIDTGYTPTVDLQIGCVLPGRNTAHENNDTSDDLQYGHGTYLAGVIRASINNSLMHSGMHFDACLLPVKVGDTTTGGASEVDVAEGLVFAADHGAKVALVAIELNDTQVLRDAVAYAQSKDVVVVAAAGGLGGGSATCVYPACYENVLGVGGTLPDDTLGSFSNFGPNMDIVAPGLPICMLFYYGGDVMGDTLEECVGGTSASAAQVAAVATYLRSLSPSMPATEVISRLISTAKDIGVPGSGDPEGPGFRLLDANAAMRSVP